MNLILNCNLICKKCLICRNVNKTYRIELQSCLFSNVCETILHFYTFVYINRISKYGCLLKKFFHHIMMIYHIFAIVRCQRNAHKHTLITKILGTEIKINQN